MYNSITVVPAQVGGGAAYKEYREVIYTSKFSAHFYRPVLVLLYICFMYNSQPKL